MKDAGATLRRLSYPSDRQQFQIVLPGILEIEYVGLVIVQERIGS